MESSKKIIAGGLGIVATVLVFALQTQGREDENSPISVEGSSTIPAAKFKSQDELDRETVVSTPSVEGVNLNWRNDTKFIEMFRRKSLDYHVSEKGERATIERMWAQTEEARKLGKGDQSARVVSQLVNAGLVCDEASAALFSGLTFAEDLTLMSNLVSQRNSFLEWERDKGREGYQLSEFAIEGIPLDCPPEIHFAHFMSNLSDQEIPPELLVEAAKWRDQMLVRNAKLYLESAVLRNSLSFTARELDLDWPSSQLEELFREAMPDYARVALAMANVGTEYVDGLRQLALSYGLEIQ